MSRKASRKTSRKMSQIRSPGDRGEKGRDASRKTARGIRGEKGQDANRRTDPSDRAKMSRDFSPGIFPGFSSVYSPPGTELFYGTAALAEGPCLTDQPVRLTELYRRSWLAKRIIDMPCEDMTRAWYTLPPGLPPEALPPVHGVPPRFLNPPSDPLPPLAWSSDDACCSSTTLVRGRS